MDADLAGGLVVQLILRNCLIFLGGLIDGSLASGKRERISLFSSSIVLMIGADSGW
ncbi:Uncharacterised protein [Salmonella enterica subsp. arizonae]|nr:Uncharacterised protein [Salmonella enterica subsp. arizonae]